MTDAPPAAETLAPEAETPAPAVNAVYIEDFTAECIDGSTFTLSEALRDHELVLINLFATWCGPCAMEFPAMQQAWEQTSDRVAVIALSIEPTDTFEVLRGYAEEMGISFQMSREEGTNLEPFTYGGYPTSLLIDRSMRVLSLECGAKVTAQEFLDWFDGYVGENYDPNLCTYTIYAYGSTDYEDIVGAVFTFCTDTACYPVTTAEFGKAEFVGPPAEYHIKLVSVPDGWQPDIEVDWTTNVYGETFWVPFSATGE